MCYQKPKVTEIKMDIKVSTNSSNMSSCAGGHCVRAPYQNDPNWYSIKLKTAVYKPMI